MPMQHKTSELTGNGCNGHALPLESHLRDSHVMKSNVNPFIHRQLQFTAVDKLRVRTGLY